MFTEPLLNNLSVMYTQVINNEQNLLFCIVNQSLHELNKTLLIHAVLVTHKPARSLVIDC